MVTAFNLLLLPSKALEVEILAEGCGWSGLGVGRGGVSP